MGKGHSDLVWLRSAVKGFKINQVPQPIFKGHCSRKGSPFFRDFSRNIGPFVTIVGCSHGLDTNNRPMFKGSRMGRSDKVSLWYAALLINTRFRFFILE